MSGTAGEVRPISFAQWYERAEALTQAHWQEIALNKRVMVLAPDLAAYERLESSGQLIAIGAFVGDEIVGYSVSIFAHGHLHYKSLSIVTNDVLYVSPAHRRSSLGLRLMTATEEAARELGAGLMLWHCKEETNLDLILTRRGYKVQDVVYSREL